MSKYLITISSIILTIFFSISSFAQWSGTNPLTTNSSVQVSTTGLGLSVTVNHSSDYSYSILSRGNRAWTKGLALQLNTTENVTVYANGYAQFLGNVGIGRAVPFDCRLAVEGKIKAREIIVDNNVWPDYVFENDYDLISLKDLEDFVKKNKHLPNIPTELEVKEEGLNLGEFQSKILQKIEELTIYIIEQNKKIETLKKAIHNFTIKETKEIN